MDICLVGGIYGASREYRELVRYTPETMLEHGLRERGHSVVTLSHYDAFPAARFDIVHVHHLSWNAMRAAFKHSDARIVFTMHGVHTRQATPAYRRLATNIVMKHADAVVALSSHEALQQRKLYNLTQAKQAVIPNGIDFGVYTQVRRKQKAVGSPWRLLYVGQLIALKRVDLLLRALALCPQDIELYLAFHVDTLQRDLESFASSLGLASRVHFLGRRTPHQLARLYQEADAFVLPSSSEALPSVITEAMACGTPVIAASTGGIPEQLKGCGILVHQGKAYELARAIQRLLEHYPDYAARAEARAAEVRNDFSIEQMIERHERLYQMLLRSESPSPGIADRFFSSALTIPLELACAQRRQQLLRTEQRQACRTDSSQA